MFAVIYMRRGQEGTEFGRSYAKNSGIWRVRITKP